MAEQLLPTINSDFVTTTISSVDDTETIPNRTFAFDLRKGITAGKCDGKQSLEQAIYLIIYTERYKWIIHDYNYGFTANDLYGKPFTYVMPLIEQRLTNAILADNRFSTVNNISFKQGTSKNSLLASFSVTTNVEGIPDNEITINDIQIDYDRR